MMNNNTEQGHRARKRFGQNFLHDKNIIQRIVKSIQPSPETAIIEIGPGLGALTESLLSATSKMAAIEIDRDLAAKLRERWPTLMLIEGDALETDFSAILDNLNARNAKIVGNLPYNISTPLLFHILKFQTNIEGMYFMLQREVVDRMAAVPGNKDYGKLTVMTQYYCNVFPLFNIAPQCFRPVPAVESTFVQLVPRPFPVPALNMEHFTQLVSTAFQQRRKTLRNAIRALLPAAIPDSVSARLSSRAEDISVIDYVEMSNDLYKSTLDGMQA